MAQDAIKPQVAAQSLARDVRVCYRGRARRSNNCLCRAHNLALTIVFQVEVLFCNFARRQSCQISIKTAERITENATNCEYT
jgi:hypothetical protein